MDKNGFNGLLYCIILINLLSEYFYNLENRRTHLFFACQRNSEYFLFQFSAKAQHKNCLFYLVIDALSPVCKFPSFFDENCFSIV